MGFAWGTAWHESRRDSTLRPRAFRLRRGWGLRSSVKNLLGWHLLVKGRGLNWNVGIAGFVNLKADDCGGADPSQQFIELRHVLFREVFLEINRQRLPGEYGLCRCQPGRASADDVATVAAGHGRAE